MSSDRKVVLVTGANRGIGKEIAKQLAARNWQVIITARDYAKALQAAEEIGSTSLGLQMDVQDEDSIKQAVVLVEEKFKKLDVLINNAGVIGNMSMLDFDLKDRKSTRLNSSHQ